MTDAEKVNELILDSFLRVRHHSVDEELWRIKEALTAKDTLYESKIVSEQKEIGRLERVIESRESKIKELEAKIARMEGVVEAAIKWDEAVDDRVESGILQEKIWALKQLDEVNREEKP